jgi:hypothetical protein
VQQRGLEADQHEGECDAGCHVAAATAAAAAAAGAAGAAAAAGGGGVGARLVNLTHHHRSCRATCSASCSAATGTFTLLQFFMTLRGLSRTVAACLIGSSCCSVALVAVSCCCMPAMSRDSCRLRCCALAARCVRLWVKDSTSPLLRVSED